MTEPRRWRLRGGRELVLDRAHVIAILNVTPDSFSDGGALSTPEDAVARARTAVAQGAAMLDIGGESTRPGAERVDGLEQIRRVEPAIRAIRAAGIKTPISVDTTRSEVARAALQAGADAVNDVSGGDEDPALLTLVAERGCGVILMHRLRPPEHDSYSDRYREDAPAYDSGVVATVVESLRSKAARALRAGVRREAIVLDPGLGFGKTVEQNLTLIRHADRIEAIGYPTLSAASRKSFVGHITGVDDPASRLAGSIAISVRHHVAGVRLFRVHDVAPHAQALVMSQALEDTPPLRAPNTAPE